ncbi:MAG: hypothetical protein PS018_09205 [bacterium]|nr:hypothetical protein [bacterium]
MSDKRTWSCGLFRQNPRCAPAISSIIPERLSNPLIPWLFRPTAVNPAPLLVQERIGPTAARRRESAQTSDALPAPIDHLQGKWTVFGSKPALGLLVPRSPPPLAGPGPDGPVGLTIGVGSLIEVIEIMPPVTLSRLLSVISVAPCIVEPLPER